MASKKGSGNASPVQEKQKPIEQAEKATENVQTDSAQIPVPEISVRIDKLFDDDTKKLKAFASANIGPFAVHGIRIFENEKGMFVNMPSNSYKDAQGNTQYPKIVQPQLEAYSDDEVEQLMEALENEDIRTRALLTLAVTTGMRRGELVGLMWDDIDFKKQIITISRSVYKPKGEEQRIKSTKSVSSNRTVYIPDSCSRVLYELKIQQASDKRHSQGLWVDSGFVFTDKYGKNISLYAPTRICAEVQAKYGLRHLKLHGLRHTCGSLMVEHGVDPETVKSVLGHESLKTTNRYLHPYSESMKEASEKMEKIIRGKTDGEIEIHLSSGE